MRTKIDWPLGNCYRILMSRREKLNDPMPLTEGNHHKKRRSKRQSIFFNKIKKTFWLVKFRLYLHYVKKVANNSLQKKTLFARNGKRKAGEMLPF